MRIFSPLLSRTKNTIFVSFTAFSQRKLLLCFPWYQHWENGEKKPLLQSLKRYITVWCFSFLSGTIYGRGDYFARDAGYSVDYSAGGPRAIKPPSGTHLKMFLAYVLVGDSVKGTESIRDFPKKPGASNLHYNSTVDREVNPTIFVTFRDNQTYPAYLITFVY